MKMMKIRTVIMVWLSLVMAGGLRAESSNPDPYAEETKEERDARMAWWREAKFGMFIHWGVYAIPAGFYNGQPVPGIGEWIMNRGKIPRAEYQAFAAHFNPVKYDADAWVRLAKRAGMKYIVITSKHHDGFTLYPSEFSDWGIGITPYQEDLLAPLAEACRKHGIKLGFYYSQAQDWNNGGSGNAWDPSPDRTMDEYIAEVAVPQVREILTRYGEFPAVLWWDTPANMNRERAEPLIEVLKLKPGIIHNNRLGGGFEGDTDTPEQHIPSTGIAGRDWETCMTMNRTWGFKSDDHDWKSTDTLIRNLVDIVSKGGNYLLNVGPTAEGLIPEPSVESLEQVGQWMDINGEAIYGTSASPFRKPHWGRCTHKAGENGGVLYLHVFQWPDDGRLSVPGFQSTVARASLLTDGIPLETGFEDESLVIRVPDSAPASLVSVIKLEYEGPLKVVEKFIEPGKDGVLTLPALDADTSGSINVEYKDGKANLGFWMSHKDEALWIVEGQSPGRYRVEAEIAGTAPSAFVLSCGDQSLEAATEVSEGYNAFRNVDLGVIGIGEGKQELRVRPIKGRWNAINLRSIVLRPE